MDVFLHVVWCQSLERIPEDQPLMQNDKLKVQTQNNLCNRLMRKHYFFSTHLILCHYNLVYFAYYLCRRLIFLVKTIWQKLYLSFLHGD